MKTTLYKVMCSIMLICVMPLMSLSQEKKPDQTASAKESIQVEVYNSEPVNLNAGAVKKAQARAQNLQAQESQIPLVSGKNLTMYQIKYDSYGHATVVLPTVGRHEINQVIAVWGKWIKVNFMGAPETYQGWINTDDANWLYAQW